MSFRIGQRVVCVNVEFSQEPTWRTAVTVLPVLGFMYTIRSMRAVDDVIGLCFEEMVHPFRHFAEGYVEPAFDSRRFRPLATTRIDIFEKLLAPVERVAHRRPLELV